MMLNKYLILLILLFSQCNLSEAQAEGQKAHFQVHNKEQGKMEIHATKQKAKISVAADSVQLVVNPGTEEVPEEDITAHTVQVHSIAGHKRSKVIPNEILKLHTLKTRGNKRSKYHMTKSRDVNAIKKSILDKEMRVHGQSGQLHVHTDHNVTAVDSQSGKLEIYIKNPEHFAEKEASEHHQDNLHVDVYTEESYKKNRLSNKPVALHIAKDVNGLKKSIVKTNDVARHLRKRISPRYQPCIVPPCSN